MVEGYIKGTNRESKTNNYQQKETLQSTSRSHPTSFFIIVQSRLPNHIVAGVHVPAIHLFPAEMRNGEFVMPNQVLTGRSTSSRLPRKSTGMAAKDNNKQTRIYFLLRYRFFRKAIPSLFRLVNTEILHDFSVNACQCLRKSALARP